jgi:hypothetical protein
MITLANLVLILIPAAALACIWDSDTLRAEAKGLPGLLEIMTGRIDRPPPLYFQMRLDRASGAIARDPDDLAAYDDAGAACDRLGRGDEAVEWMARKKTRLDAAGGDAVREHLYRYHANLGTFLAHRWFRAGADRSHMKDLRAGRDHIAEAIRVNPDAHFGREKYQLQTMDWIVEAPGRTRSELETLLDTGGSTAHEFGGSSDAVKGLSGLIALGNAWDSFDVFAALAVALSEHKDAYLAHIAWLRCGEIADAGGRSLHPENAPWSGEATPLPDWLKENLRYRLAPGDVYEPEVLDQYFRHARREADLWHKEREEFMLARLSQGRHPDTDASFWDGYAERPVPRPPSRLLAGSSLEQTPGVLFGVSAIMLVLTWLGIRWRNRRRSAFAQRPARG